MGNYSGRRLLTKRDDHHAPAAMTDPANRAPRAYEIPPDEIETECPGCTLEWRDGGWHHDRACVMRRAG